jgi:hypothetical protein
MIQYRFFKNTSALVLFACVATTLVSAQNAMACTITNWTGTNTAVESNATEDKSYQGLCGLRIPLPAGGYVEDPSPVTTDPRHISIFYFNKDEATLGAGGSLVMHQLLNGATTLVSVVLQGSQVIMQTGSPSTGIPITSGWYSAILDWDTGTGNASLTVANVSNPAGTTVTMNGVATQTVETARLGVINPSGAQGFMAYDSYTANRATAPTRLVEGDANGNGTRESDDASAVFKTLFGITTGVNTTTAVTDCDENGVINSEDASCVFKLIFGVPI